MKDFISVRPEDFNDSAFRLIGKDWMLITVRRSDGSFNQMTASWGGMGYLWNRNVCFAFIRPERYTFEFSEDADALWSFSFFDEKYRPALKYCGKASGRDGDKAAACGLTGAVDGDGYVFYKEAKTVITANRLYSDMLKEACFNDRALLSNYAEGGYHKMYICDVKGIFEHS